MDERISVSLPVSIENDSHVTRDISASGVYFETNTAFGLGERIEFVIEFGNPGGNFILQCNGEIIRVENKNNKIGVAVKIKESQLYSDPKSSGSRSSQ